MIEGLAHRYRVFIVCATGIFITVFDTSSAIVALPTIALELGTHLPTAQWVIIGNSLTIAALLVPMGRLSDLIGRKRIYVLGCLIFGVGALLAAASGSIFGLIGARILVGVGSAMTQGTAMAILVGNFELNERARMLGLQMGGVGLGAMAGPGVGGLIVGAIGWKMLFVLTGAAMIVIALAAQRILHRRAHRPEVERPPFDVLGAVLFSGLLTSGLLTLTLGSRAGWSSPTSVAGMALFAGLVIAFIAVERRHPAPMLDFGLFHSSAFALGAIGALVAFMCISSMRFLAPFYFQGVKGFSASQVGLLMLPAAMVMALTAPFVGRLADIFGVRLFANIGFSIALVGLCAFTMLSLQTPTWIVVASLAVMGLGMSTFSAPNSASILNSVGPEAHGVAAGFVNLCRNTGNVLGIAFGTAVVTLSMSRAGYPPSLDAVGAAAGEELLAAFAGGMQVASLALICLAVPVLTIIVVWTIRRRPRQTR